MNINKSWEKVGKYKEAQDTVKRIEELRNQEDKRQRAQLEEQLKVEYQTCEEAHKKEVQAFFHRWEKIIIPEFEKESSQIEQELKERHQRELEEFKENLKTDNAYKYRNSPDLLNLQRQIESLASVGKYLQAKKMKAKFSKLEKAEKSKHQKEIK